MNVISITLTVPILFCCFYHRLPPKNKDSNPPPRRGEFQSSFSYPSLVSFRKSNSFSPFDIIHIRIATTRSRRASRNNVIQSRLISYIALQIEIISILAINLSHHLLPPIYPLME